MEDRPSRGRGGSWRRGGRGGNDGDSHGGEHRGRGRGGQHRGRGRRDHYRGRGRGGSAHAAEFHHRDRDEGDDFQDEADRAEVFSRRKLESNWDRYAESEKKEPEDDTPTQRGTDYHVLLESAGDSFTQFRFSEEKDWEMDSFGGNQMSAAFVDLPALAQSLQQLPLHQRLNLEAELLQLSTPVELPSVTLSLKPEMPKVSTFTPPSAALKVLSTNQEVTVATNPASGPGSKVSSNTAQPKPEDEGDEELDQLLSLQKPVQVVSGNQAVSVSEERAAPEEVCDEVKDVAPEVKEEKIEEVKNKEVTPPSACVKQAVTEEDLEDWLDSMIS